MTLDGLAELRAPNASPMTLDGTRTYVVGRTRRLVIDPGPADERHLRRLVELLASSTVVAILLTHHHPDHAGASAAVAAATGAPVLMGAGSLDVGFPPVAVDEFVTDGRTFETDVGQLQALATPGHVPEHMAYFWNGGQAPRGGALFVGDLLMGVGDTTLLAPPEGDLAAYLETLQRLRRLAPAILFPTHGPPLDAPTEAFDRYLRHRHERIARVLELLGEEPITPARLVEPVYGPTLDPRLRRAAESSLLAILEYLQGRRQVERQADGYRLPAGAALGGKSHEPTQPLDPR